MDQINGGPGDHEKRCHSPGKRGVASELSRCALNSRIAPFWEPPLSFAADVVSPPRKALR